MNHTQEIPRSRIHLTLSLVAAVLFASSIHALAVSKYWNVASGDWNGSSNWNPTGVAGASDNVYMNNGGLVNVTDAQSATSVNIGHTGGVNNRMTISSTGTLTTSTYSYIGWTNTEGIVSVAGTWTGSGLYIGYGGTGNLSVENGGNVSSNFLTMGGSTGSVGTLTIQSGGNLSITTATGVGMGNSANTTANATVSGMWTISGALNLGFRGAANLVVNSGGVVTSVGSTTMSTSLDPLEMGSGSALVRGTMSNTGDFRVGDYGAGVLTVGAGGIVNVNSGSNIVHLAYFAATASGVLNIGGAVTGNTPGVAEGAGVLNAAEVRGRASGGTSTVNFNHTDSDYHFTKTGTSGGANILISGAITTVNVYSGKTTLNGTNTYGGGTTITAGTLVLSSNSAAGNGGIALTGTSAATLQIQAGVAITNGITFSSSNASSTVNRMVGNGTAYTVGTSGSLMSSFSGGTADTTARIRAGTNSQGTTATLDMGFAGTSSASNDGIRVSDVFSLHGTATDTIALQLNLAGLTSSAFLGWLDGGSWVNAVSGNSGSGALAGAYATSFDTFVANHGGSFNAATMLGAYGVDTVGGSVWAVINHNSDFAAIPEPGTGMLLAVSGALLLLMRRRLI